MQKEKIFALLATLAATSAGCELTSGLSSLHDVDCIGICTDAAGAANPSGNDSGAAPPTEDADVNSDTGTAEAGVEDVFVGADVTVPLDAPASTMDDGSVSDATSTFDVAQSFADASAAIVTITGGDNQTVPENIVSEGMWVAFFAPLVVNVTTPNGDPLVNALVDFGVGQGAQDEAVQIAPFGGDYLVVTDSSGNATLNAMPNGAGAEVYYAAGAFTVTATCGSSVATFQETATPHP